MIKFINLFNVKFENNFPTNQKNCWTVPAAGTENPVSYHEIALSFYSLEVLSRINGESELGQKTKW